MSDAFKSPMTTDEMISAMSVSSSANILCARQRLIEMCDELKKANAREKAAFMAGFETAMHWDGDCMPDKERAWQSHRCQDDTDCKTTDDPSGEQT